MTILYIDLEHERIRNGALSGPAHHDRIENARLRLALAAGEQCAVLVYNEVSEQVVDDLMPNAIVISGNTADWSEYDAVDISGLLEIIRAARVPIFGICGGHQLIGHAHGAPWGSLGRIEGGDPDPDPRFAPGMHKQRGFLPVNVTAAHPLFDGLDPSPVVFQSHYWQLTDAPAGFAIVATSPDSPIQAIARHDRPVFGVQFHPERYDDAHPDGATILHNFFRIARNTRQVSTGTKPTNSRSGGLKLCPYHVSSSRACEGS